MQRDNVSYKNGGISEIRCRECGTPIRTLIESDSVGKARKVNGHIVMERFLVLGCLPNYREVLMACSDGSAHVACMCAECSKTATLAQMQEHHDLDVAEMGLAEQCKRTVLSIARVAPHIGAV